MLESEYTFDLDRWIAEFPVRTKVAEGSQFAKGPMDIAIIEQIRQKAAVNGVLGNSVPVDVFVFGLGEPTRRDVTKIGGMPYRPSGLPWPNATDNSPMTFLAQFRFVESRALLPQLPGDMLLVFAKNPEYAAEPEYLHFEWYPVGLENLVSPSELPNPGWDFLNCYGVQHRSVDFQDPQILDLLAPHVELAEVPRPTPLECAWRYVGMKIGGLPLWDRAKRELPIPRLLCSIPEVIPRLGAPFPFVNHAAPTVIWNPDATAQDFLQSTLDFGFDGLTIYLYLQDQFKVGYYIDFYS